MKFGIDWPCGFWDVWRVWTTDDKQMVEDAEWTMEACPYYTQQKKFGTLGSFGEFYFNLEWMHIMLYIIV